MRNRIGDWRAVLSSGRLKRARLRWPAWVWGLAGVLFLTVQTVMAVRTGQVGIGKPGTGQIRIAPFVLHGGEMRKEEARKGLAAVRRWRQWMDSLRTTAGGVAIYDSILLARPGLLDSAQEVEEFYLQQFK